MDLYSKHYILLWARGTRTSAPTRWLIQGASEWNSSSWAYLHYSDLVSRAATTVFSSVYWSGPNSLFSRPQPDCLYPPNGSAGSNTVVQFSQTVPARMCFAIRCATAMSLVQTFAAKP